MQNRQPLIKKNRAFTLVEVMIAVSIFSVIAAGTLALVINSLYSFYTLKTLNELSNNACFAMDEIVKDIRETGLSEKLLDQITDPDTGNLHSILVLPFIEKQDRLIDYDADDKPIWQGIVVYYPFMTDDGISQIRKYRYYQILDRDIFPLTASVTSDTISIFKRDALLLHSFNRANDHERALANHVSASPVQGHINFIEEDDAVLIMLYMQKPVTAIGGLSERLISASLNSRAVSRN
jgi:prepilin-type N-terminal cleavage/methylation domain-containing protein